MISCLYFCWRALTLFTLTFTATSTSRRRSAIKVAGGWKCDTVTEDLDLSYEAFIHARRFVYVPELPQASDYYIGLFALWFYVFSISRQQHILQCLELTETVLAHKKQKTRWTKGFFQVARKRLWRILTFSHLPLSVRIEAFFHMTSPLTSFLLSTIVLSIIT